MRGREHLEVCRLTQAYSVLSMVPAACHTCAGGCVRNTLQLYAAGVGVDSSNALLLERLPARSGLYNH